ncbi:hypothetical protein K505DRAFT_105899 [Melanomma pulvis-pyrius CBS 109.77]|uniref:Aminoglycoside phosphotransferase domain-containing protein n=1 Tax=Melanomma pulvis-pyrius CBS 109.77 TaxID=1314802 RepID=A0A6A6WXF8_9PLEO|nr:hypothetical protein K505DRAFT_105899 [Melanomma pulvis-pyrius CBS 109.77]
MGRRSIISTSPYITLVHEPGDASAVWSIGNQNIPEYFLLPSRGSDNFSSFEAGCRAMGIDCSTPVFSRADLGSGNIIVEDEPTIGAIGIIDPEIAGYFPRGWSRSKFGLSSGMNLSASASDHPTWWRSGVQKALGVHRFEEHADAWMQ